MVNAIKEKLFAPINIYSLVFVRIVFGLIMFVDICNFFYSDLVTPNFIEPEFHFKYYGFDWVTVLPENLFNLLLIILAVSALCIAIGAFYKVASVIFLLGFTYIFLLDQALYLNHYYMVIIFNFLLCFMPANRYWALDSHYLNPKIKTKIIPAWPIILLRIQMEIILIYAGIVKINSDWLHLYPLTIWFRDYGPLFNNIGVIFLASYGSILLHILGAPLLLSKRYRIWIFLVYAIFHNINSYIFTIGIFPWITLALTTVFFQSNWPIQFSNFIKGLRNLKSFSFKKISQIYKESTNIPCEIPEGVSFRTSAKRENLILILIVIWSIFHILFPLRKFLYEGNSFWTHQGSSFAWELKLYDVGGSAVFLIKDNKTNQYLHDYNESHLTPLLGELHHLTYRQARRMSCTPFMIMKYAHFLKERWAKKLGHDDISVYSLMLCSLNDREPRPLIDQKVDLSREVETFSTPKWVLPLDENLRPGGRKHSFR